MKITNRNNFPEALLIAVSNDPYSRGASDYSVTQLLKPPRVVALEHLYKDELVDDVEDRLWSLYGQIAHLILERANIRDLSEERFFGSFQAPTREVVVSAQVDTLSLVDEELTDWKFSTSWNFKEGQPAKEDWVCQMNMQRELLLRNGKNVRSMRIVGLLRDWSKLEAKRTSDYPQKGVMTVPIDIWPREKTQAFIEHRIALHENALKSLPLCNAEEMWAKPDIWAVVKGGKAVRFGVQYTEEAAHAMLKKHDGASIEFRPGVRNRCESYCSVSEFCTQYKEFKERKVL